VDAWDDGWMVDVWVDGWNDGWVDGWMDGTMVDGWVDGMRRRMGGWMGGWMGRWSHGPMDGWVDVRVDGWNDGWVDGWMDGTMVDGWDDEWDDGWLDGLLLLLLRALSLSFHQFLLLPPLLFQHQPPSHGLLLLGVLLLLKPTFGMVMLVVVMVGVGSDDNCRCTVSMAVYVVQIHRLLYDCRIASFIEVDDAALARVSFPSQVWSLISVVVNATSSKTYNPSHFTTTSLSSSVGILPILCSWWW